jgi:DNA modification methylase
MKENIIYNMDCLEGLKSLPDNCVDCCITSPPYFGLRDYGVAGQIGLEETPEDYVQRLVNVFAEVYRVLKPTGTLWVNIGDSYATWEGIKPKDLLGIPWLLAFELRRAGWYLRQDIIWHKPNAMPESVTDRCTKSHEYIFLLSKTAKYYFDNEAIFEPVAISTIERSKSKKLPRYGGDKYTATPNKFYLTKSGNMYEPRPSRNKRSVWSVSTKPFKDAHFATFPDTLIVDCIKAGSPENGLILDPFMGSGTTAVVARKLSRNYIGFELNPEYVEISNRRIKKELGIFQ